MEDLCSYANRPWAFVGRYLRRRILPHLVILVAVLGAVGFSVSTDYALKGVVDSLSKGPQASHVWTALAVLIGFIAADNMLWRVAALVGAKEHALRQVAAGVDIVVAQGGEAGGHCGEVSTMVLIPEVVRALEQAGHGNVPVLAAGGIMTGGQMAAAMAMGAAGAWTGSV